MNTYEVTHVEPTVRNWMRGGTTPMKAYRVTLKHPDGRELGNVEISKLADAPVPNVGEKVEGEVDREAQYGPKFKPARRGGTGGGRSLSPEERRAIASQSSNQRGVEAVRIAVDAGAWKPESLDEVVSAALNAADAFYQRVMKAEAGA